MTKLLFVTQVMDKDDGVLGAYHGLVAELAHRFEQIEVICLKEGSYELPSNVRVHSLGKERGSVPAIVYAIRFKFLAWKLRHNYDAVFVHMNQEYILVAGLLWKLLGKRIYMWRNHYAGSLLTDIAAAFCTNVFCTSKHSYTAKYKKTIFMPVGVDTARFSANTSVTRIPHSILFFARIAPSKRPDMFVDALSILHSQGEQFEASIYGSPTPENQTYYEALKSRVQELGLQNSVQFFLGVPNAQAPIIFQAHEIFVNCSPSGMYDKTLFEAAASGCAVLTSSEDFGQVADNSYFTNAEELSAKLQKTLNLSLIQREEQVISLKSISNLNSLSSLCRSLSKQMGSSL